ncbi:MAG: hypothetical protein WBY44_10260, partial [Bryobacteraceae bacterium]
MTRNRMTGNRWLGSFALMASFPVAGMAQAAGASDAALRVEVIELRALVKQLEARVDVLERRGSAQASEAP